MHQVVLDLVKLETLDGYDAIDKVIKSMNFEMEPFGDLQIGDTERREDANQEIM